jgi:hypothetical protein
MCAVRETICSHPNYDHEAGKYDIVAKLALMGVFKF